jgi:imidazole glycerol-phosphate synthase subunit HisF
MIKKRVCFTLLYFEGSFCISRNFNLQKIGDINWLLDNYDFENILQYLDELIILNINKNNAPLIYDKKFFDDTDKILKKCFLPVSLGGGVNNLEIAKKLFNHGADKIVLNSAFFDNTNLITGISNLYGSQSVVSSVDYKNSGLNNATIFTKNGNQNINLSLKDCIENIQNLGAGELILNSIDRDGLGYGYDYETLKEVRSICGLPIIASGGADNHFELLRGIECEDVNAVSTSHLFNFMGEGLSQTRKEMIKNSANIPIRNFKQD